MSQVILNGLVLGSLSFLVAYSLILINQSARFFHFGHDALIAVGAYLCYSFYIFCKFPLALSIITAVISTGLIGLGLNRLVYRNLRVKQANSTIMMICSLGVSIVVVNILSIAFGQTAKVILPDIGIHSIAFMNARLTLIQLITMLISLCICVGSILFFKFSPYRLQYKALSSNPKLAVMLGINTEKVIAYSFFVSCFLAGLSGILLALDNCIIPGMGANPMLFGIIVCIISSRISYLFLVSTGIGILVNIGIYFLGSQWQYPAILVLFLIIFYVKTIYQRYRLNDGI